MDHPADFDKVTVTYPVDLRLVAECVNSTSSELQDLNPQPAAPDHAASWEV